MGSALDVAAAGRATPSPSEVRTPGLTRHRRRRWLLPLMVVTIALASWAALRARRVEPTPVSVVVVSRGKVRDFVTSVAAGRVAGRTEAGMRAETLGTVRTLHHRRGDWVKAGEPLVSFDERELRDRLKLAESAVLVSRAQMQQAHENEKLALRNLERAKVLAEGDVIPQAELDSLGGQAEALARALDAARASTVQAQANMELARVASTKATVAAPFDGTVLSTSVEPGETVIVGAPLVTFADVSSLHVDAEIDEADVGKIRIGMPADVSLDAFPGERVRGALREIAPSVTDDPRGGRSVRVEVTLPHDERLRVGMSADVDVIVAVHEDALWLPPSAVQGRGAERAVFVVSGGVAHRRVVDVGIATWEAVEIRDGVHEGEDVVANLSATSLTDGARVAPRPIVATAGPVR